MPMHSQRQAQILNNKIIKNVGDQAANKTI